MKKMLLFLALLATSSGAFAQNAALNLVNHNTVCTVYVYLYAADADLSNYSCDIRTCVFVIPPSTTLSYANPSVVYGSVGYCLMNSSFGASTLAWALGLTTPQWAWTDAEFQYECGDCAASGRLSGAAPASCTLWPISCYGAGLNWNGGTCTPLNSATWSPAINCVMTDVTLDFY